MSNVLDHGGHGGGGAEQGQQQQQQQGDTLLCYFHPRELLVGVCAHCLRERLLLLLASNSKQQGNGKFEDNGKATWADNKPGQGVDGRIAEKATTTAVVEHARRGGATRWRKQVVGRLLQLARWKRASSSSGGKAQPAACHVKAAEQQRAKGRGRGWIRSLTRRRAAHGERAWS